jgi:hypothetical protein
MPADIPVQNPVFFGHNRDMRIERAVVYTCPVSEYDQRPAFYPAHPIVNRTALSFEN